MTEQSHNRELVALFFLLSLPLSAAPTPANLEFFENKVRPLLATNCFPCHTNSMLGGLRLDSREGLLKGGGSGPAIVPGDPDKSLLIASVRQSGELKMPKGGKLKKEEAAVLEQWVKDGMNWDDLIQSDRIHMTEWSTACVTMALDLAIARAVGSVPGGLPAV